MTERGLQRDRSGAIRGFRARKTPRNTLSRLPVGERSRRSPPTVEVQDSAFVVRTVRTGTFETPRMSAPVPHALPTSPMHSARERDRSPRSPPGRGAVPGGGVRRAKRPARRRRRRPGVGTRSGSIVRGADKTAANNQQPRHKIRALEAGQGSHWAVPGHATTPWNHRPRPPHAMLADIHREALPYQQRRGTALVLASRRNSTSRRGFSRFPFRPPTLAASATTPPQARRIPAVSSRCPVD